jgi:hypothetical protein
MWGEGPEPYLSGGVSLVPLAPRANVAEAQLPELVERMAARINAERISATGISFSAQSEGSTKGLFMRITVFSRRVVAMLVVLAASTGDARAQWIGAGSTPQGDYLRGAGIAAAGMGLYNQRTAIANSINLDTFIRFNEYMAAVANEQRKEYVERRMYLSARNKEMNDKIEDRIKNHPEARDVLSGDALTSIINQLMDPEISESSFRYAQVPLPVDMIRRIPFRLGERGENFSMHRLTMKGKGKWPVAFQDTRFAVELKEFEAAVDAALEEAIDGKAQLSKMARIQSAVEELARKLEREVDPDTDRRALNEAALQLKSLRTTVRQFETQGVQQALGEIATYSGTTVNDLRLFMRKYNLTFGRAETPDERLLYPELYEALQIQKEKFAGGGKAPKSE